MPRLIRTGVLTLTIVFSAAIASFAASPPTKVASAPLPSPLIVAKKALITNGVGVFGRVDPNLVYDEFYAQVQRWGRYVLVADPADADIVLQLSAPYPGNFRQFQLQVRDPQNNLLFWTTAIQPRPAITQSGERKSVADAITKLIDLYASQIGAEPLPKLAPKAP